MIDLSTMNGLRRSTMLRDFDLDRTLIDNELAVRLLNIELRLRRIEGDTGATASRNRRPRGAKGVV